MCSQFLRTVFVAATLLFCSSAIKAQSSLPIGPTNAGTDFWVSFPANWEYQATSKYIRLYITSISETRVVVSAGRDTLQTLLTTANDVVSVDIPTEIAQVFIRNDATPVPADQVYSNKALHIESEDPIVVYGINRTSATSDGMLLLPVNALGQEYIIASAQDVADGIQQKLPSQYMIIAPYDSTEVTIVNANQTPNHQEGESVTITLNKGDVYSAMSIGFNGDLSGSYISASRPVAVTAGQNCTYLPDANYPTCDHLAEMMFPISSWGTTYHSVPYANRTKGDMYRIFAGADSARIYINGTLYATLIKKGGPEGVGFITFLPPSRNLLQITSDKPIMVAQYNNSQRYDNSTQTDPFVSVLVPLEQYQKEIVFSTPDADFPQNFVNLVCDSAALFDIEIAVSGTNNWQNLLQVKGSDYSKFAAPIDGLTYVGKRFEIAPGAYRMRGPRPFGAILYGAGFFDSYGYPLAASAANVGSDDSSAASVITSTSDCNLSVTGVTTDMPADAAHRANLSIIALDPEVSGNYHLNVDRFITSLDRAAKFTLNVVDPLKPAMAVIVSSDMAGNVRMDTVRYEGAAVQPDKRHVEFGNVGETMTKSVTLTNQGSAPVVVSELQLLKGDQYFTITPLPELPFTLEPGAGKELTVEFSPAMNGSYRDSLGAVTACGTLWISELTGVRTSLGVDESTPVISRVVLSPNPAAGETALTFALNRRSTVKVALYTIDGRQLRVVMPNTTVETGEQTVRVDVRDLSPGVYPLRLTVGGQTVDVPSVVVQ